MKKLKNNNKVTNALKKIFFFIVKKKTNGAEFGAEKILLGSEKDQIPFCTHVPIFHSSYFYIKIFLL
jgi:hypothetical protein